MLSQLYVPSDSVHPFRKNAMVMIRILGQLSYLQPINNSIQSIKEAFKTRKRCHLMKLDVNIACIKNWMEGTPPRLSEISEKN